jgi:DNA-binding NarL/FixJ family response regulator
LGEGLRHLNERSYDIALVDLNLSGIENDLSGGEGMLEFLKTLREPIGAVVLTSEEDPQFVADLVQDWGVSRFVSKGTITKQGIAPLLSAIELALASTARARNARPDIIRLMAGGSEQEQIWVHIALQTLSPDGAYQGLAGFLNELLRTFYAGVSCRVCSLITP